MESESLDYRFETFVRQRPAHQGGRVLDESLEWIYLEHLPGGILNETERSTTAHLADIAPVETQETLQKMWKN